LVGIDIAITVVVAIGKAIAMPWNWYQHIPKLRARSMKAQTVAFREV
jgi:hypothetical protein